MTGGGKVESHYYPITLNNNCNQFFTKKEGVKTTGQAKQNGF